MVRYLTFSVILIFILTTSATYLLWLSVETTPKVTTNSLEHLNNADNVAPLLQQIQSTLDEPSSETQIDITQTQINSIQALLQRSTNKFRANSTVNNDSANINMTYVMTINNVKRFINLQITIESGEGLAINNVKVGRVTYPGWLAKTIAKYSVNLYTKSEVATALLNSIDRISMEENTIQLKFHTIEKVLSELMRIDLGEKSENEQELQKYTLLFLTELNDFEANKADEPLSLNRYINFVFKLAKQNSHDNNAALVNEAAILSLAIFTGDSRFSHLLNTSSLDAINISQLNNRPTLAARTDLAQHFIISAALQIISRKDIALAIGEFKELMDRAPAGSGYSFVDLAADRAGVKFAEQATDQLKASLIQQRLSSDLSEDAYLPKLHGLSEGLHMQSFVEKYTRVDSPKYRKDINLIKTRIRTLSLYAEN